MIDDLYVYQQRLDDPGEGDYDKMMQSYFLEHVQLLLCSESVDEYWAKLNARNDTYLCFEVQWSHLLNKTRGIFYLFGKSSATQSR